MCSYRIYWSENIFFYNVVDLVFKNALAVFTKHYVYFFKLFTNETFPYKTLRAPDINGSVLNILFLIKLHISICRAK